MAGILSNSVKCSWMNIIVSGIHFEDFEKSEDYAKEKVAKLSKFNSKILKIEVRLFEEQNHLNPKHDFACEIKIALPGNDLEILDREKSIDKAIDKAVERMKRLLVKSKEKSKSRFHRISSLRKLLLRS